MNKPPQVGDFYRLVHGYRKNGSAYSEYMDRGIYVVIYEDNTRVELRLVSKIEFHGSGRRWLKKSKFTDSMSHADFKARYTDDAVSYLTNELAVIKEGYKQVLGEDI